MSDMCDKSAKDVFTEAMELRGAQRDAFIEQSCRGDEKLHATVKQLLAYHDADSRFLEESPLEVDLNEVARWAHPDELLIGEKINGWTIDRVIATGGMGTIYQASSKNKSDPVAIKLMRSGIASENAMRRFRFEADVLAHLNHDGIARVLESGTHDDGLGGVPFFVMEYVDEAQPITEYSEAHDLNLHQRVELFAQVCDAIHHGHQKGVIHRDLKPANILVDSSNRPKVIDFGVARATDSDLAVTSIATSAGDLLGTLQYMSPEQCGTDPGAVDVRSDIYALGMVLYELICGTVPYDVREVGVMEAVRRIRESKPPSPREAGPGLPEDISTIVLKALEKEPQRRYQSAVELAADLRRFLDNEPIMARPPSAIYQMRKFARRNKGIVAGAVVAVVALVGAVVVSTMYALSEAGARKSLETKSAGLQAVNRFFSDFFEKTEPGALLGHEVTVREVLDQAAASIDEEFHEHPLVEAEIRVAVGNAYIHLGKYSSGLSHLERAVEIRRKQLGASHRDTLIALTGLGNVLRLVGRPDESVDLLEDVVAQLSKISGDSDLNTIGARNALAISLHDVYRSPEAIPIAQKALDDVQRYGVAGDPEWDDLRHAILNNLGLVLDGAENRGEAADIWGQLYDELIGEEGASDPNETASYGTVTVMSNYGGLLSKLGRYDEAELILRRAVKIANNIFESNNNYRLKVSASYAGALNMLGRYEESEVLQREVLAGRVEALGADHIETLQAMAGLGALLTNELDRAQEAEPYLRDAVDGWEALGRGDHPYACAARNSLAINYHMTGKYEQAVLLYQFNIDVAQRALGRQHQVSLGYRTRYAAVLRDMERYEEADEILLEVIDDTAGGYGREHWRYGEALIEYGEFLLEVERFDEAEENLTAGYEVNSSTQDDSGQTAQRVIRSLVQLYDAWDKPDEAAQWRAKLPEQLPEPAADAAPDS